MDIKTPNKTPQNMGPLTAREFIGNLSSFLSHFSNVNVKLVPTSQLFSVGLRKFRL